MAAFEGGRITALPRAASGEQNAGVSVVIGTCGWRASIRDAVATILASQHVRIELIVVDQGPTGVADYLREFRGDDRLTHLHSSTRGVSAARNIGIATAHNELVLIVDDDVTVGPTWAADFSTALAGMSDIAVAFCGVEAASFDQRAGFIPQVLVRHSRTVRSLLFKSRVKGLGAGMAVRRDRVLELGGFDEMLGPGAPLRSNEDRDLAMRALTHGWSVLTTADASVTHHGFRTWDEGRELTRRDWFGIGATYAKSFKTLDLRIVPALMHEVVINGILHPLARLMRGRPPNGLKQIVYFVAGFSAGLKTPLDRETGVYHRS
jgi:GT2 family glycosyltransferase